MKCIILGDKYQKGMKSKGCAGLIRVNKKYNILQNQYYTLKSIFPDLEITYVYGFDGKKLLDFLSLSDLKINCVYNEYHNKYNHIFSLGLVSSLFNNEDIIIVDGYKILDKKFFKKFNTDNSQIFINNATSYDSVGCVINKLGNIENLNFDLGNSLENIYYLDKQCSSAICPLIKDSRYYNYFIFEILNKLIDKGYVMHPKKVESQ